MILVKYEKSRTRKRKIAQHLNMKEMGEFIEMNSHTTSGKLSPHLPTSSCYQSREPPKFLFITKPKLYFTLCYFSFIFSKYSFHCQFWSDPKLFANQSFTKWIWCICNLVLFRRPSIDFSLVDLAKPNSNRISTSSSNRFHLSCTYCHIKNRLTFFSRILWRNSHIS